MTVEVRHPATQPFLLFRGQPLADSDESTPLLIVQSFKRCS